MKGHFLRSVGLHFLLGESSSRPLSYTWRWLRNTYLSSPSTSRNPSGYWSKAENSSFLSPKAVTWPSRVLMLQLWRIYRMNPRGSYWFFALQQHHSPVTPRCHHWNLVWTSDILIVDRHFGYIDIHFGWFSEDSGCWYKRNYQGRCSNRTFAERVQVWARKS